MSSTCGIARWLMRVGSVIDYRVLLNFAMTTCLSVLYKNIQSLCFICVAVRCSTMHFSLGVFELGSNKDV